MLVASLRPRRPTRGTPSAVSSRRMGDPAPILVIAFRRPEHLARALASLAADPTARRSPLRIHVDGPRNDEERDAVEATVAVAREAYGFARVEVFARPTNAGLSRNVTEAVSSALAQHDRVIVVEDDLELSTTFLTFMNHALDRYALEPRAMQVSGYQYPMAAPDRDGAAWLAATSCWGWGTWRRAWSRFDPTIPGAERLEHDAALRSRFDLDDAYPYAAMLASLRRGEVDSWGIVWHANVLLAEGLTLFPGTSLVCNHGFDGSGRHGRQDGWRDAPPAPWTCRNWPAEVEEDLALRRAVSTFLVDRSKPRGWRGLLSRIAR